MPVVSMLIGWEENSTVKMKWWQERDQYLRADFDDDFYRPLLTTKFIDRTHRTSVNYSVLS